MRLVEYLRSDARLLAAIFWALKVEGTTEWRYVIGWDGEWCENALLGEAAFQSGLARLVKGGLVADTGSELLPIDDALAWYQAFAAGDPVLLQDLTRQLEQKLSAEPCHQWDDPRNNLSYPGFTRARYNEAVTEGYSDFSRRYHQREDRWPS